MRIRNYSYQTTIVLYSWIYAVILTMKKVSVIIPTYNSSKVLSRAIDSALNQTYENTEIIVVDDASMDNTEQVVKSYQKKAVKYIKHEQNKGASAARNTGLSQAVGDYIGYLDADDEWHPQKLEKQLAILESRSDDWVAVNCDISWEGPLRTEIIYKLSSLLRPNRDESSKEGGEELIKDILLMNLTTGASTLLVKREIVESIDGFDPDFPRHQDWEFLIRVLEKGKLAHVDEPLVTKYYTGRPPIQDYVEGKELLQSKFSDEIAELENDGHPITELHQLQLCKRYFASGHFIRGFQKLLEYKIMKTKPDERRN